MPSHSAAPKPDNQLTDSFRSHDRFYTKYRLLIRPAIQAGQKWHRDLFWTQINDGSSVGQFVDSGDWCTSYVSGNNQFFFCFHWWQIENFLTIFCYCVGGAADRRVSLQCDGCTIGFGVWSLVWAKIMCTRRSNRGQFELDWTGLIRNIYLLWKS